jgi:hypothetical protein
MIVARTTTCGGPSAATPGSTRPATLTRYRRLPGGNRLVGVRSPVWPPGADH